MKTTILLVICCIALANGADGWIRYGFYRSMQQEAHMPDGKEKIETRRVFGGEAADLKVYPAVAALLDRYWNTKCSGAVITTYWAVTAAHCVTSKLAYIKYNTRSSTVNEGSHTPILYLFRHPDYKVVQQDEGRGMDVTLLHHDLGLIRSKEPMVLKNPIKPLELLRNYKPGNLDDAVFTVMGFGRTEAAERTTGEELFAVKLRTAKCDRTTWVHCMCGVPEKGSVRGVCSGDSGGPVVYQGIQVAVTSMGPIECATSRSNPQDGSTSVFTSLYNYLDLINDTIVDTENLLIKRASDQQRIERTSEDNISTTAVLAKHLLSVALLLFVLIT